MFCLFQVTAARQKKRPPTKREKDTVMKALKERDALIKQIESIGPNQLSAGSVDKFVNTNVRVRVVG